MNDRIKLAEAMGWTHIHMKHVKMDGKSYPFGCPTADQYSDGVVRKQYKEQIPDPFTDANDCEALIYWLNSIGWFVDIDWQITNDERMAAGAYVHIWHKDSEIHHRTDIDVDRWKEGLCRLALKVLE